LPDSWLAIINFGKWWTRRREIDPSASFGDPYFRHTR
jgi:hypothetical protein